MSTQALATKERFPMGQKLRFNLSGNPANGSVSVVIGYLRRDGEPDRISHLEVMGDDKRLHVITVNRAQKNYIKER